MNLLPTWYLPVIATIFGLVIGSFLNVVIYRVPAGVSLMGRSGCPKCGHQIRAYDNIPIFAWFILRGKCRDCREPISTRYPIIEAVHGAIWGLLALHIGWHPILPLLLIMSSISLVLFMIDIDTLALPNKIVWSSWILVILGLSALAWHSHSLVALERAGVFALAWGAFYGALWLFSLGRALGFGDVKLAPVYGALTGWFSVASGVVGFAGAFLVGGIVAIVLLATGIVRQRGVHIPYGPMLITGAWMGIIWGIPLSHFYLHIVGLR